MTVLLGLLATMCLQEQEVLLIVTRLGRIPARLRQTLIKKTNGETGRAEGRKGCGLHPRVQKWAVAKVAPIVSDIGF